MKKNKFETRPDLNYSYQWVNSKYGCIFRCKRCNKFSGNYQINYYVGNNGDFAYRCPHCKLEFY